MKKLVYLFSAAALLVACEKNSLQLPIDPVTGGARIKLVNAAPDVPGVELALNGKKVSAFTPAGASSTSPGTPTALPYNATFPSAGSNYAVVPAGQQAITVSVPASTTAGSATVINTQNLTLEDGKYYSLFVAGTGSQPEVILVNDNFTGAQDPNKFYVRFVNLVPGSSYDLFFNNTNTILSPDLAYKAITPFVAVDAVAAPAFGFRLKGATANIGSVTFSSLASGRAATVFIRGVTGRTGTAAPAINVYTNR